MILKNIHSTLTFNWMRYLLRHPTMFGQYGPWRKSLQGGRSPLNECFPWLTYEAIDWLESYLKPEMCVFEWGSGGSTLFLAKRVRSLTSIEHDIRWYEKVLKKLQEESIANANYLLIQPERGGLVHPLYSSTDERYQDSSFQSYVEAISLYPDSFFHLVVIDGRARMGCIVHAVNKICRDGYLLLDDSEREEYSLGEQILSSWRRLTFFGPVPYIRSFSETSIWQKPRG